MNAATYTLWCAECSIHHMVSTGCQAIGCQSAPRQRAGRRERPLALTRPLGGPRILLNGCRFVAPVTSGGATSHHGCRFVAPVTSGGAKSYLGCRCVALVCERRRGRPRVPPSDRDATRILGMRCANSAGMSALVTKLSLIDSTDLTDDEWRGNLEPELLNFSKRST